jgi:hypothetical protein
VIISNSTIASNSPAASGQGGGIYVQYDQKLIISNSTVVGNTSDGGGGGIYSSDGSTVIISNSTIAGNLTSLNGGGIANDSGLLVISNSTIFGNNAVQNGAGISNTTSPSVGYAATSIIFTTIFRNQAGIGGALAAVELNDTGEIPPTDVYVELDNSMVVDNQSDSGPDITGTLTTGGYNLFQNFDKSALLFDDPYHRQATDQMVTDLSFIGNQLQNVNGPDGKPVPTQMLPLINMPGNPAIDAIPPGNRCPVPLSPLKDLYGNPLIDPFTNTALTLNTDHDQRGVARPFGPGCDIGAYEYNGA